MVDVDETTVLLAVFVVLLVTFPLISVGTTEERPLLWQVGIALLVVGGLVPPITRYVFGEEDDAEDDDAENDAESDDAEGETENGAESTVNGEGSTEDEGDAVTGDDGEQG